jgi:N-glycosidase YbiA
MIASFSGEYGFLSNFYLTPIHWCGHTYRSVEHAYQAMKSLNDRDEAYIRSALSPAAAKRVAATIARIQPEWDELRIPIMTALITVKFARDTPLADALCATDPLPLVEGNTWDDTFWGVCNGKGTNHLGQILMARREVLVANLEQMK